MDVDTVGRMQLEVFHAPETTRRRRSLPDYTRAILAEVDGMALRVGRLLREAKVDHPGRFGRWIEDELPFGPDMARRLMAISRAYETLDEETLAGLPRPWQAMYALRKLSRGELRHAISTGAIGPGTTIIQAQEYARPDLIDVHRRRRADVAAGALMDCDVDDLDLVVLQALVGWLRRGGVGPLPVDPPGTDA